MNPKGLHQGHGQAQVVSRTMGDILVIKLPCIGNVQSLAKRICLSKRNHCCDLWNRLVNKYQIIMIPTGTRTYRSVTEYVWGKEMHIWKHISILQWRHNERDGVSNYRRIDCLLNRLFGCRSKKTSKLRVTGLWEGNLRVTVGFPSQMFSNAENVSI